MCEKWKIICHHCTNDRNILNAEVQDSSHWSSALSEGNNFNLAVPDGGITGSLKIMCVVSSIPAAASSF